MIQCSIIIGLVIVLVHFGTCLSTIIEHPRTDPKLYDISVQNFVQINETIGNIGDILIKKRLIKNINGITKYKLIYYSPYILPSFDSQIQSTIKEPIFMVDQFTGDIQLNIQNNSNSLEYLCKKRNLCSCDNCLFNLNFIYLTQNKINAEMVRVFIDDINQHVPKFHVDGPLEVNITENIPIGTSVLIPQIAAEDKDIFYNKVTYVVKNEIDDTLSQYFNITSQDRDLRLTILSDIDYEKFKKYELILVAQDNGGLKASIKLIINIIDINDNAPQCLSNLYQVSIRENTLERDILQILTYDADSGMNGQVEYTIRDNPYFIIDKSTGWLSVIKSFDYEIQHDYQFKVRLNDKGIDMEKIAFCNVKINIIDENDNQAKLAINNQEIFIQENNELFKVIGNVSIFDLDSLKGVYELSLSDNTNFRLVPSGERQFELIILTSFDYEQIRKIPLEIRLKDGSMYEDSIEVNINIIDLNDNSPKFAQKEYIFDINEEQETSRIGPIDFYDSDSINCNFTFKTPDYVTYNKPSESTLWLTIHKKYDFEVDGDNILFDIVVVDCDPNLFDTTRIRLIISDVNDHEPEFLNQNFTFFVDENSPEGTQVGTILVADQDSHSQINLQLKPTGSQEFFELRGNTLFSKKIFDAEQANEYKIEVEAIDNGIPALRSQKEFLIRINDLNDNIPKLVFPKQNTKYMNLKLNEMNLTSNWSELFNVKAIDDDINSKLIYTIQDSFDALKIDSNSGQIQIKNNLGKIVTNVYLSVTDGLFITNANFTLYFNFDSNDLPYEVLRLIKYDADHSDSEILGDNSKGFIQLVSNSVLIIILLVVLTFMILISVFILITVYRRFYAKKSKSPVDLTKCMSQMKDCLKVNCDGQVSKRVPANLMVKDAPLNYSSETYESPRMDLETVYNLNLQKISKALDPSSLNSTLSQNSSNTILTDDYIKVLPTHPSSTLNSRTSSQYYVNNSPKLNSSYYPRQQDTANIDNYFKRFERIYNDNPNDPSKTYIHLNYSQF